MENEKIRKIIPLFVLLVSLVLIGIFLVGQEIASFEAERLAKESVQAAKDKSAALKKPVKILFVGDLMFDRYIRQISERKGSDFVFAGVKDLLAENDLAVGNLEGPITDKPSISAGSEIGAHDNYIFTFNAEVAKELWKNNLRLVSLGNNHILNFGADGLVQTKKNLQSSSVDFFGDSTGEKRLAVWEKNGAKIIFVSYNQFEKEAKSKTLADLEQAKKMKADFVLLYAHWGTEFAGKASDNIKKLAHDFIDSGADLIIGSHPHVVQNKEEYKGKLIYYSLGNFIFDQYFSPETQQGLAVQFEMNPQDKKIVAKEIPVSMKSNGQTVLK